MKPDQFTLLEPQAPAYPSGFVYKPDFITPAQERDLVARLAALPFKEFDFHGYKGKRRVVSFGWHYDFSKAKLEKAEMIPDYLRELGQKVAGLGMNPDTIEHVLVNEYAAGAGIGWHRDRPIFEHVVGVSLLAPCKFRLRREVGDKWERKTLAVEPRSAYLLSGAVRWEWEHSIPPLEELRYSITFRNFTEKKKVEIKEAAR
jgi:alkylated DNA repair dioxygenase AlkB